MADAVRKYLDARRRLDEITGELNDVASVVGTVAEALKTNPARFMFSNTAVDAPPDLVLGHATRVEGDQWPGADQIQQLLIQWHAARKEVVATWALVHKSDQLHLRAPEH